VRGSIMTIPQLVDCTRVTSGTPALRNSGRPSFHRCSRLQTNVWQRKQQREGLQPPQQHSTSSSSYR
jgi:hypothetical protein